MVNVTNQVKAGIALVIVVIVMLAMADPIITQVESALNDSDSWTFTGSDGAESIVGLIPLIYYASILLVVVAGAFGISRMDS